ncbi:MAG: radical SAM family heme chaperone HemW [Elusimicrobiota bacterium]
MNVIKTRAGSLYVHIPYCISKCNYCVFVSTPDIMSVNDYISKLREEIFYWNPGGLDTVFIGGGTPSILSTEQFTKIGDAISKSFALNINAEFTVECNPATLDPDKIECYRTFGVNRISIGCQSFNEKMLKILGRVHSTEDIYKVVEIVNSAGIDNFGFDLIYGLPGQDVKLFSKDLELAVSLVPKHLSLYALELEEGAQLYEECRNGKIQCPKDDVVAGMYEFACEYLHGKGYRHYEISNFALPGFECKHNMVYWQNREYIGAGVAACGYIRGERYRNTSSILEYLNSKIPERGQVEYTEKLESPAKDAERVILGLRTDDGVELSVEESVMFMPVFDKFKEYGLLEIEGNRVSFTRKGMLLSNQVFREIVV